LNTLYFFFIYSGDIMKARHFKAAMLGLTGLMAVTSIQAADVAAGQAKAALCAGCHGADVNSINVIWPRLAGQHASYLEKQLHDFKSGKRKDATMTAMVASLNEDDIKNIASYFSSQKPAAPKFDASVVEKGQDIYRGGITDISVAACMGCHSPNGEGNGPAVFPRLKGQHPEYVAAQLQKFKDGTRTNDNAKMMQSLVKRMSSEEMKAVAAYVAAMK
jgi:cytochrome c553